MTNVPKGWKLVPEIPTLEMVEHARTASRAVNFRIQDEAPRDPVVIERLLISAAISAAIYVAPTYTEDMG